VENFEHFEDNFKSFTVGKKILRINYRSTEEIVEKSSNLMNSVEGRVPKDLMANKKNGKGDPPQVLDFTTEDEEFSFIAEKIRELKGSISLDPEEREKAFGILCRKNEGVKEFLDFISNCPNDGTHTLKPHDGEELCTKCGEPSFTFIPNPDDREIYTANFAGLKINLKTVHKAKGEEFSCVFVEHVEDGTLPLSHSGEDLVVPIALQRFKQDLDDSIAREREERRILYVAMTRAKKQLFLTYHTKDDDGDQVNPSPFLNDIKRKWTKIR
jgi:superfamily I DNA/RNA helicase